MLKFKLFTFCLFVFIVILMSFSPNDIPSVMPSTIKDNLSEYGFFEGKMSEQKPAKGVVNYGLNMPLFSDYAQKLRFVQLPDGKTVDYNADSVLQFPIGTKIIKTFYYPNDFKDEKKGRRILETRVLLRDDDGGWVALPYVWNDEQTEATLEPAGDTKKVVFKDAKGKKQSFDYLIPNVNQCRGCHIRGDKMSPIGPSARQLNGDLGAENQLLHWSKIGILRGLPPDITAVPKFPNWEDKAASLDAKARAYLDINCAHCHNLSGPAVTSGLFLDWKTKDSTAYGFYKTPVAAGRGSGNLKYDIFPQKPAESILLYRMATTNPGEMMPEVGRALVHTEGVELIREWIKTMK
ncbi:MAG: hypothetical protein JNL70_05930 [Saprospiraceae bacterium]|nr:hypothetical protein [Saprospiraceae bacterium]